MPKATERKPPAEVFESLEYAWLRQKERKDGRKLYRVAGCPVVVLAATELQAVKAVHAHTPIVTKVDPRDAAETVTRWNLERLKESEAKVSE